MEASLEVFYPKLDDEHSSRGIRNIRALQRELNFKYTRQTYLFR